MHEGDQPRVQEEGEVVVLRATQQGFLYSWYQ